MEGWEGYRVDQVDVRARNVVPLYKPNLVLVNAGTNDATQGYYVESTGERMRAMINYIFDTLPNTCVVFSTLLPNTLSPTNVALINSQYRALAQEFIANGKRLVLVEFDNGWLTNGRLDRHDAPHRFWVPEDGSPVDLSAAVRSNKSDMVVISDCLIGNLGRI